MHPRVSWIIDPNYDLLSFSGSPSSGLSFFSIWSKKVEQPTKVGCCWARLCPSSDFLDQKRPSLGCRPPIFAGSQFFAARSHSFDNDPFLFLWKIRRTAEREREGMIQDHVPCLFGSIMMFRSLGPKRPSSFSLFGFAFICTKTVHNSAQYLVRRKHPLTLNSIKRSCNSILNGLLGPVLGWPSSFSLSSTLVGISTQMDLSREPCARAERWRSTH